ncbi:hypothetical protein BGX20_006770, partial [Mortierella sp. AD010]
TVVLSEKPHISTETDNMDPVLLEELLMHIASLSAIYHKAPTTFIPHCKPRFLIPSPTLRRQNYGINRGQLIQQDSLDLLYGSNKTNGDNGGKQPQHQRLSYHEQSFEQVAEASIGNQEYYEQKINAENPYRADTAASVVSGNKGGDLMSFDL